MTWLATASNSCFADRHARKVEYRHAVSQLVLLIAFSIASYFSSESKSYLRGLRGTRIEMPKMLRHFLLLYACIRKNQMSERIKQLKLLPRDAFRPLRIYQKTFSSASGSHRASLQRKCCPDQLHLKEEKKYYSMQSRLSSYAVISRWDKLIVFVDFDLWLRVSLVFTDNWTCSTPMFWLLQHCINCKIRFLRAKAATAFSAS